MEVLDEMKRWVTMSRQKERKREGLKTLPVAGMRMAHLIPSEKVSSYTMLKDPIRGGVETTHEVSGRSL